MSLIRHPFAIVCPVLLLSGISTAVAVNAQCGVDQHRVSVADSIEMTEVAPPEPEYGAHPNAVGSFSPDGQRFAVILKKGNLRNNTNVYTLLLFSTQAAFRSNRPEATMTMASNSNRPAISDLRWLKDGHTLLFLGEEPDAAAQIYSFDLLTKRRKQLTTQRNSVVRFDASDDGRVIVFEAEPSAEPILDTPATRRAGFVVNGDQLSTLLLSGNHSRESMSFIDRQLFVLIGDGKPKRIAAEDAIWPHLTFSVSPDGRYALVGALVRRIPPEWMLYKDHLLHEMVAARKQREAYSEVQTYLLLNTKTSRLSRLFNAPKDWPDDGYLWLDRGSALVVSHAYLPLSGVTSQELEARESHPFIAEVSLPSRTVVTVGRDNLAAASWNETVGEITVAGVGRDASVRKTYRRRGDIWEETPSSGPEAAALSLSIVQDMNSAPAIWLLDPSSDRRVRLLDLNPQFAQLCFGHEREIIWKATDGHEMHGGLYLPPDYAPGRQYPLVIQTHAFDPKQFWVDGPWNSAFAAQPLAAKDIAVLQMGYDRVGGHTAEEAPRTMAAIDGAIDYLAAQGIVDPNRVGIIGFSRTVYHVAYTLTHSSHRFAAATLADGFDGDYFQAIAFPTTEGTDAAAVNGGPPYGAGLTKWIEHSPLFAIDAIRSPIRIESYGIDSTLEMWGWYSLLSQAGMPVDMIVLPDGPHLLVKPWERLVSQQGNVDWFTFWLKGEEDPAPGKATQYVRWHQLCRLLDEMPAKTASASLP